MKPLNEEIEATLNSLEGLNPAKPGPDFKTKVMARWEESSHGDQWLRYLKYGIAAMILMAMVNILTLLNRTTATPQTDEFTAQVVDQYLDASDIYESSYE